MDHTFGIAVFAGAVIWGHELCESALAAQGDEMKAAAKRWLPESQHTEIDEVDILPPSRTFSDRVSLRIGREVSLTYHGFGHTDADIVVRVADADVAFFGDLIEEGSPPAFSDSHPVAWPLTLAAAANEPVSTIVPGHGDVVGPEFVQAQREELAEVARLASEYVAGSPSLGKAVASGPYRRDVMTEAVRRARAVA